MPRTKNTRAAQHRERLAMGIDWQNEMNLVFTYPDDSYIPMQTVLKRFKRIAAKIGRPDARFHDLRHTYAVMSLQEGDDVKTVQQNLGHATASFTLDVYGHVSEKMKQESAARMDRFIRKVKA
ncbi:MAG: tyrosine-type recombinase/integrase [Clostridia bacterium]|nr:tyrosine-type recombinase/integrase [Clostridia bacterium]